MLDKALDLAQQDRHAEAIEHYDELASRYAGSTAPALREQIAKAFYHKAFSVRRLNGDIEAVEAYRQLGVAFGSADEPTAVQTTVAQGFVNQGVALHRLGRYVEEIELYDKLIERFGAATVPDQQAQVALSLYNKGLALKKLDRHEDAALVFDDLAERFPGPDAPAKVQTHVAKSLSSRALVFDRLGKHDEEIAVYDAVVNRFGDSPELETMKAVARALKLKAITLKSLNRPNDALDAYDGLLGRFGNSSDQQLVNEVLLTLERKGRTLRGLGRVDEALETLDNAIERLGALEPAQQTPHIIETLVAKALALNSAHRLQEAAVVIDGALSTYQDMRARGFPLTAKSTETITVAAIVQAEMLASLGRAPEITKVPERFEQAVGIPAEVSGDDERPGEPAALEPPSEQELAGLLADTHAGDYWFSLVTGSNDHETRLRMADEAVDLYRRTEQWLNPDPDTWEEHPFLAAMALRSIADGYALLSHGYTDDARAELPLPTRAVFERGLRVGGLDDWAEQNGHPLDLRESDEAFEELLEEQREKIRDSLDTDSKGIEHGLATAFALAVFKYQIVRAFSRLPAESRQKSNDRLQAVISLSLATARSWTTYASEGLDEAAGAVVAMMLMAQSSFSAAHRREPSEVYGFPDPPTIREFLDLSDALSWLGNQEVELPDWLAIGE